mmetsp:Transcript_11268/g.45495  ORF Transcript_11268/g.45495 Transcript_11268/m.45495 type:complete len:277 (-) Transcript_11268:397-1227(-)
MAGNTQHGTTAKGLPRALAKSTMASVASSGCMPITTLHSSNLCQFSGVNISRTCAHRTLASSAIGASVRREGGVAGSEPFPSSSRPFPASPPFLASFRPFFASSFRTRALSHLCCIRFSLRGRGSTSVHGTPRFVCSSKLTSPRPPATSSTPDPRDNASAPKVSTSQSTKTRALAALVLAPPPSACGSPSTVASALRLRLRSEIHAACVSRDAWAYAHRSPLWQRPWFSQYLHGARFVPIVPSAVVQSPASVLAGDVEGADPRDVEGADPSASSSR